MVILDACPLNRYAKRQIEKHGGFLATLATLAKTHKIFKKQFMKASDIQTALGSGPLFASLCEWNQYFLIWSPDINWDACLIEIVRNELGVVITPISEQDLKSGNRNRTTQRQLIGRVAKCFFCEMERFAGIFGTADDLDGIFIEHGATVSRKIKAAKRPTVSLRQGYGKGKNLRKPKIEVENL